MGTCYSPVESGWFLVFSGSGIVWSQGRAGRLRRRAAKFGIGLAVILVVGLLVRQMSILDQLMVYFPERGMHSTPGDVGLDYEDVSLVAADGARLHGWHVPGKSDTTLLWFHGNAGNISHRLDNILLLNRRLGLGVFIFDYRGYGKSDGKPSEAGLYADAEAAIDFLTSDLGLDPIQDVVLYGRSLGVGVAVEMATRHEVRGVVLESGFASVKEMVRLTRPRIPTGLVLPLFDARYDSISKIGRLTSPVMIVHGTRDDTVPFEMAKRLYEAAPEPKRLHAVPGASHNDTYLVGGEAYIQALSEFVEDSPGLRDATSP